jgi:hypothetical protein
VADELSTKHSRLRFAERKHGVPGETQTPGLLMDHQRAKIEWLFEFPHRQRIYSFHRILRLSPCQRRVNEPQKQCLQNRVQGSLREIKAQ